MEYIAVIIIFIFLIIVGIFLHKTLEELENYLEDNE